MDPAAIRAALGVTLAATGARVATSPPDLVNPPQLVIWGPDSITYGETFDSGHRLTFTVRALVGRAVESSAQAKLDAAMADTGTASVYATIEADNTLGGAVMSAQIVSAQNPGAVVVNDVTYLAVDFTVDVMT